jgi:cytochrome c-type biogenesis protein CcmH
MLRGIILLSLIWFSPIALALTNDTYPFTSLDDQKRFFNFTHQTRCVVCQHQTIAESDAPLAKDLRNKIYHFILEKKSDQEIKLYLTKRYGEFILLNPQITQLTLTLWGVPIFCLIVLLGFFLFKQRQYDKNRKAFPRFSAGMAKKSL